MFSSTHTLCAAALCGLLSLSLFSCEKKNSNTQPTNVPTEERLSGKWEVIAFHIIDYREDTLYNISEYIKGIGQVENGTRVQGWIEQYHTTFLTLQNSHNFFHTDFYGNFDGHMLTLFLPDQGGTWSLKNTGQIEMTTKAFEDGITLKPMVWNVAGYDGNYFNAETVDTYSISGAKAATRVMLELERQ